MTRVLIRPCPPVGARTSHRMRRPLTSSRSTSFLFQPSKNKSKTNSMSKSNSKSNSKSRSDGEKRRRYRIEIRTGALPSATKDERGFRRFWHRAFWDDTRRHPGVEAAIATNSAQAQRYSTIQVTESHELTLIRQCLTQVRRAQVFSVSTGTERCCNLQTR